MVVLSIFKWLLNLCWKEKNENMQIWSRYNLFKNTDYRLPASSSAALTRWGWDKLAATLQTTFSKWIWLKMSGFRLRFDWHLFPGFELTMFQHWFIKWLGTDHATNHHLIQWWSNQLMHICANRFTTTESQNRSHGLCLCGGEMSTNYRKSVWKHSWRKQIWLRPGKSSQQTWW